MRLVFIDVELSGIQAFDQVVDFSAIENGKTLRNSLVGCPERISEETMNLTGLNMNDFSEASPNIEETFDILFEDIAVASYGLQYDLNWINHTLRMYGKKELQSMKGICLRELHTHITRHWVNLDDALKYFYPRYDPEIHRPVHRSMRDAILHYKLYQKMTAHLQEFSLTDSVKEFIPGEI
ncbi:hypothetical protein TUMSATVNIG1_60840 (plasmid) [Vibrio nigripulchritudo]|uniref:hypothetical protein n=1 Tax=Vibrio nigripulchritudo TaxID=28173 RepID=UPI001909E204|nr:hypothetical protein [Vibrio nigripulchritudo]BCL74100.1 hypothetical protein VNTUMSATTG_60370 [Vibrio nigripulchritudo]BDU35475.1 hypothetical protein TUMSATVNIG1_60840 [Vibrio nigripulchritudo]